MSPLLLSLLSILPPLPPLLLFLSLLPLLHCLPQAGTASGHALKFQGQTGSNVELASFRTLFRNNANSTYPTILNHDTGDGDPFTISFWFRLESPLNTDKNVVFGENQGIYTLRTTIHPTSSSGASNLTIRCILNIDEVEANLPLTYEEAMPDWHHFALTDDNKAGGANVSIYFNGQRVLNNPSYDKVVDLAAVNIMSLGSYITTDDNVPKSQIDHPLSAAIDELAIYKRALDPEEIQATYNKPLDTDDETLLIYYDFEDAYNSPFATNLGAAGSIYDLLLGSTYLGPFLQGPSMGTNDPVVGTDVCRSNAGEPVVYCSPAKKPTVVQSRVPLRDESGEGPAAGQALFAYAVLGGDSAVIELPGADPENPDAPLVFATDTSSTLGSLTLDSDSATATYTPPLSSNSSSDLFTYTVTSNSLSSPPATVRIIFVSPPTSRSFSTTIVEDRDTIVVLHRYDPAGLATTATVTSLPASGTLYELDAEESVVSEITTLDLPKQTRGTLIRFMPAPDNDATTEFEFTTTNSYGLVSPPATITISVFKNNDIPAAAAQTVTMEASALTKEFTVVVKDPDSTFVSLFVDTLPVHGKLYYDSDTSSSPVEQFTNLHPPPMKQFGLKILETSTFWPDANKKWHPDQALGPPDTVATNGDGYRDSVLALCYYCRDGCDETCAYSITTGGFDNTTHNNFDPVNGVTRLLDERDCWDANAHFEEEGFTEFFTMQFDEAVYVKDIEIGENIGPGSIVSIEAFDYATKSWMVMWSGKADYERYRFYEATNQFSTFIPYPICQPNFKTDIVKIKMDTKTIDAWCEIDYVKLVGGTEPTPGILPGASLVYEAPSSMDCVESFTFSMSDCGGSRSRTSEAQTFTILPANGGMEACEPLVEELDERVPLGVVFGIVGGAVALVLVIVAVNSAKEKKLVDEKRVALRDQSIAVQEVIEEKTKGEQMQKENDKLKNDVAIMQEYNKDEIAMLESQIKKFTQDMSATDGVHKDMEKLLIKADELVGKVVIGAGAYGEVYKSDYRGTAVAVKTMKQVDEETLERFQGEIMLMSGLRHQNVVTMVGCCWEKNLMALVMEFCEKGTSTDVLKAEGDHLAWDDPLLKWLLDVSRGMSYLHGMTYYDGDRKEQVRGIIHRDLKPDNCLVTETWGVKIADFGEARAALEEATMTQVGTPIYISPEVVKGEYYSEKADVFSFAMTILQFCLKKKPLLEFLKEEYKTYQKREPTLGRVSHEVVVKGWRPGVEKIEGVPRGVIDLLGMCWTEYPDARPTFGEIVDYTQAEVRNEVMDVEGGGTEGKGSRRTSTSGGLAMRIKIAKSKKKHVEEETEELRELGIWKIKCAEMEGRCEEMQEELKRLRMAELLHTAKGKTERGMEGYLKEVGKDV